jgi:uncharacterized protein (DUF488 family)
MRLYTIGYEGLDQQGFLNCLQRYQISVVADVRRLPFSRKKGFSKNSLASLLSDNDIEYISFRELGASKELRTELKETKNYQKFFKEYQEDISEHYDQLDAILSLVSNGEEVTLLCFERDAETCHRKALAEEAIRRDGNGLKVMHISPWLK